MKIIFLDIDGVLALDKEFFTNREKFCKKYPVANELRIPYPWNKGAVKIFNDILEKTNAEIVLSSDWRQYWNLNELDRIFKFNGVIKSPISITDIPKHKSNFFLADDRIEQIKKYIDKYGVKEYVVIDDLNMEHGFGDRFFLTYSNDGIKRTNLDNKIIKRLNNIV